MRESQEWSVLGMLWREQEIPAEVRERLARRLRRQTHLMRAAVAAEVAILGAFAGFTYWFVHRGVTEAELVLLGLLWVMAIGATVFSNLNRRGTWRVAAEDTLSYLRLAERRARGKLRVAWAVGTTAFAEAALVVALLAAGGEAVGTAAAAAAALAGCYLVWAVWYGRRARSELQQLGEVRALVAPEASEVWM